MTLNSKPNPGQMVEVIPHVGASDIFVGHRAVVLADQTGATAAEVAVRLQRDGDTLVLPLNILQEVGR